MFKRIMTDQRDNSPEVTPNCWACGGNINATDRFCSKCGAPRKLYSQEQVRPRLRSFPPTQRFARTCGGKVINALQVLTSTDRSQEPTTMHARVRNHHVAGLGSIATSTATKLCNRLGPNVGKIIGMAHERAPIATNDEQCDAKVVVAREATADRYQEAGRSCRTSDRRRPSRSDGQSREGVSRCWAPLLAKGAPIFDVHYTEAPMSPGMLLRYTEAPEGGGTESGLPSGSIHSGSV